MGAVGFVLISKLGTQQLLFRTDPRKKRRSKHWEIIADKSQERRGGAWAMFQPWILRGEHSGSIRNLEHFSSREVLVNMDRKFI
jgi:hypothetical protein